MEKINVAELLKDCPRGMELDCTIFNNVTLQCVDNRGIWIGYIDSENNIRVIHLTCYGGVKIKNIETKCVIFPKGKTTWEGFQRPFKDGDILATYNGSIFVLYDKMNTTDSYGCYVGVNFANVLFTEPQPFAPMFDCKLATEEEKQKLFDSIKAKGYKWNAETKTLEELPKFKVGDRIRRKNGNEEYIIISINDCTYYYRLNGHCTGSLGIQLQDEYELVPNKFDINTLVPFESRVLVRDTKLQKWSPAIWGFYDSDSKDYQYKLVGIIARYCIPYEGNEHLLGKTDDCNEYFKTWK